MKFAALEKDVDSCDRDNDLLGGMRSGLNVLDLKGIWGWDWKVSTWEFGWLLSCFWWLSCNLNWHANLSCNQKNSWNLKERSKKSLINYFGI